MPQLSQGDIFAFVITTGFAAGLNVYATALALGAMARLHWIDLPAGLEMLRNTWILSASGALFSIEVFADKIPGFDLAWNALHTFVRIPVAALMAYAAGSHLPPASHMLATCLGAGFAAIAHGSKSAARVAVTASPEPLSNIALSSAEDAGAIGISWMAVHHPMLGAAVVGAFATGGIFVMGWGYRLARSGVRRLARGSTAH